MKWWNIQQKSRVETTAKQQQHKNHKWYLKKKLKLVLGFFTKQKKNYNEMSQKIMKTNQKFHQHFKSVCPSEYLKCSFNLRKIYSCLLCGCEKPLNMSPN